MNKEEIIKDLEKLNEYKRIGENKQLVFKDNRTFKILSDCSSKGALNPFNNYSYEWVNTFLYNVIDCLKNNDFDNLEELKENINENLYEWVDNEVNVYNSDLTKWLNDNVNNMYYLDEVLEEQENIKSSFDLLRDGQYKAIEETFNLALSQLMTYLEETYE